MTEITDAYCQELARTYWCTLQSLETSLYLTQNFLKLNFPSTYNVIPQNPRMSKFYQNYNQNIMSRPMGKPTICIGENKGADQLRGNREADQRLCFRYSDSTILPLLNSKVSSF